MVFMNFDFRELIAFKICGLRLFLKDLYRHIEESYKIYMEIGKSRVIYIVYPKQVKLLSKEQQTVHSIILSA